MSDQDRYIPGVPCWVDTSRHDPEPAVDFYRGLFGWEFEDAMPAESPDRYFIARLRGGDVGAVASLPEGAAASASWNTYIWVRDAEETAAKVRAAGGRVLTGPVDVGDAGRMAVFADLEGATFLVWQARRHRGAAVVNEPGSLNFNDLHTRDPEAARAFYGAVFGWTTLEMGGGAAMWALPGYGDFLEQRNPGMRERVAELGAPKGFEDVVAALDAIVDGSEAAPHWGVTFGVADADAVARRAFELGGRVVVAPRDAPWVRMTVIADPDGATFIASQFVPENKDVVPDPGVAASA